MARGTRWNWDDYSKSPEHIRVLTQHGYRAFERGARLAVEFGEPLSWGIEQTIRFNPDIRLSFEGIPIADVVAAFEAERKALAGHALAA